LSLFNIFIDINGVFILSIPFILIFNIVGMFFVYGSNDKSGVK
jgi:hypothetical protein